MNGEEIWVLSRWFSLTTDYKRDRHIHAWWQRGLRAYKDLLLIGVTACHVTLKF